MSNTNYEHIRARTDRGVVILTIIHSSLKGDEFCSDLKREMLDAVAKAETTKVVLDLQFVTAATSRALGVMSGFHRNIVKEQGGTMALAGLSPVMRASMAAVRFIADGRSAPLVEPTTDVAKPTPVAGENRSLFQIVADDERAAVDALLTE